MIGRIEAVDERAWLGVFRERDVGAGGATNAGSGGYLFLIDGLEDLHLVRLAAHRVVKHVLDFRAHDEGVDARADARESPT